MSVFVSTDSSLFQAVTDWENLLTAYRKAARGKRGLRPAAEFEFQVADRLVDLQKDLCRRTYRTGGYRHFAIYEPKQRKISAAPFRDRVVHHALCNIIEPIFDWRFIPDSYANRTGKGTHRAVDRLQVLMRTYRYALRMDIVKHFPSLDHAVLYAELAGVLRDEDVLWLIVQIMQSGAGVLDDEYEMVWFPGDNLLAVNRPRGLPIGNLTSQFWSNCYMNSLDWFITRSLGCAGYVRYVDDFVLLGDDKARLYQWKRAIADHLARLRLTIHADEAQVVPVESGVPWLGFVVYPDHRLLKRRNVVNFTRRFERNLDLYQSGRITFAEMDAGVQGWINHVRYADTWGLRQHVFDGHPIRAGGNCS